jgi:hypothetical protein
VFVAIVGVAAAGFIVGTQSANAGLGTDTTTDAGAGSGSVLPASLIIGAGIGGLVFVIVLVAAFVLSVSIPFCQSLLMIYFYYLVDNYCQNCFSIGTTY